MHDRRDIFGLRRVAHGVAHGGAPYPHPRVRASRGRRRAPLALALLVLVLLGGAGPVAADRRPTTLRADGRWKRFEVRVPEQALAFRFETRAGCRYRLTVECRSLGRALLAVARGDETLWRADSEPAPDRPAPEPAPARPTAFVVWDAAGEGVLGAEVRGFSALTGSGRIRLETLGPDDEVLDAHRRLLAPGGTLARVGELWVGEPDGWDLVVEPGRLYELRTRPGTAGRLAARVVAGENVTLGEARPTQDRPYPRVRFRVPAGASATDGDAAPLPVRLEVRALDGDGGTYGVRLLVDPPAEDAASEEPTSESAGLPSVPRRSRGGRSFAFEAEAGDVACLYLPEAAPHAPHHVERRAATGGWLSLPQDALSVHGARASMRTAEGAALVWFRPFRAGHYRFRERAAPGAVHLHRSAADVPDAPLLLGTGRDPAVPARAGLRWRPIAVGVCMPGWPYVFVAVPRTRGTIAMRARTLDGRTLGYRPSEGEGLSRVPGLGPSLRFRVKTPRLVRLEVQGRRWEGHALLRRAGP